MNEANRLLVVDDDENNRDMLSRRLERSGFAVQKAADGHAALECVREGEVDLVLLDSMMPGLSGVDVLRLLRATSTPDELPVIMVTAVSESAKVVEALGLGANDYVTKPVDFPIALARIRSQLARKEAENALRRSEERYALAARGSNEGLWDWDLRSQRVYYSARWKQILGYSDAEIQGTAEEWLSRVHPADDAQLRQDLDRHWSEGSSDTFESEHRILHRLGEYRWVRCTGAVVRDPEGHALRMAGSMTDITEAKVFDPLTGRPNRLMFRDRLEQALCAFHRDPAASFAVLFLDLDHFKLINDSLGHSTGDELLLAVSERLRRCVRAENSPSRPVASDLVARMGGDEFAILLSGNQGAPNAENIAQRVLAEFKQSFELSGRAVLCSISIGIAPGNPAYANLEEVLRDADTAMYRAKSLGRSRYEIFNEAMRARVLERLDLENDLRQAVENGEIITFYQPKIRLSDERICGFEALARWRHPRLGIVPPLDFIPLAEETGLIHALGVSVLREACRQLRHWQCEYPADPPLTVSVNISPVQLRHRGLVEEIQQVLRETELDPACLRLEITESLLIDDAEHVNDILDQLKRLQVGLKIDDFGTGYSSLSRLAQLPFDTLKLDRSFVVKLTEGATNLEIVHSIVCMARALGMDVVAEGVEEGEQAQLLKSLGCEFAQGFLYSKPVTPSEAGKLIEAQRAPVLKRV
jgi:diguanylate cyclase (GGDEF)-like protein/PAS domain S-box-containing protein